MLRVILKFGVLLGVLLVAIQYSVLVPILNLYFDESISGVLRFACTAGVLLFAINNFLKHHNADDQYNYGLGFILSLATGLVGTVIYATLLIVLYSIAYQELPAWEQVLTIIRGKFPMIIFLAIIIPATFRNKKKQLVKQELKNDEDILDSGF